MEKWLIPYLEQEMHKMSLEHFVIVDNKKVFKELLGRTKEPTFQILVGQK
jgi:hypothetical protein